MQSNLEQALAFAQRGLRVFPIAPGSKKPPKDFSWPRLASSDADTIRRWFTGEYERYGVAAAGGNGFFMVDADVKDGAPGLASLDLMSMMGADLGFLVATPSGGRHAYFRITDGHPVPTSARRLAGYPGIDIRGDGGYVVAPGTPGYEIVSSGPMPEAPEWLVEIARGARKHRDRAAADATSEISPDHPVAIERATQWLRANAVGAIEGERNDRAYDALCMMRDFGVGRDRALLLVDEHWNHNPDKVESPLNLEEMELVADSVYRGNAQNKFAGSKLHLAEFEFEAAEVGERRPTHGPRPQAPALILTHPRDLVGMPPPREWIAPLWIPKRKVTLLSGNGATGKTLISQQLATSRAAGKDWIGRTVAPGSTLCVFSEDDDDELWRRQDDINEHLKIRPQDLEGFAWLPADRMPKSGWTMMTFSQRHPEGEYRPFMQQLDDVMGHQRFSMLVLDAAANVFGGDEMNRNQVTTFVGALTALCTKHDASLLLLAHPSVAGMQEETGRSGSTGWANATRSRIYLRRPPAGKDPTGDQRYLSTTKANYSKEGTSATVTWEKGCFREVVGPENPIAEANRLVYTALGDLIRSGKRPTLAPTGATSATAMVRKHPDVEFLEKREVDAAIRRLIEDGMIDKRFYTGKNRTAPMYEMLVLPDEDPSADSDL